MSIGDETGTGFETMRGRNWPTIRQFTVFLENRVGELSSLLQLFEGTEVRIVALAITEATECAFVRLVFSDPEEGGEILSRAGLKVIETDLIAVELPDVAQPLLSVCTALLAAEINLIQLYSLLVRPGGRPVVALLVDNIEMAQDTLHRRGLEMLREADLDRRWDEG